MTLREPGVFWPLQQEHSAVRTDTSGHPDWWHWCGFPSILFPVATDRVCAVDEGTGVSRWLASRRPCLLPTKAADPGDEAASFSCLLPGTKRPQFIPQGVMEHLLCAGQLWAFKGTGPRFRLPRWLSGRESSCQAEEAGLIPGSGRFLEKELAAHSSILAWELPWTEEPGGLQSVGLQKSRA